MKWYVFIYINSILVFNFAVNGSYIDAKRKANIVTNNTTGSKKIIIMPKGK